MSYEEKIKSKIYIKVKGFGLCENHTKANYESLSSIGEDADKKIKELEQQLSNSISKDEVRGLVEEYETEPMTCGDFCDSASQSLLAELNKLLTNKEEG